MAAVADRQRVVVADDSRLMRRMLADALGADVVGLPHGAVVELDRAPDEPIDLFVNGRRFATGRLVVVDGDWAVRIESVLDPSSNSGDTEGEVARWPVSS